MSVLNKRTHKIDPKTDVYIGRPSKWGNPFVIGKDGNRTEVVEKYRGWLLTNKALIKDLPELYDKNLVCWCAPQACHGDVLIELVKWHKAIKEVKNEQNKALRRR